MSTEKNHRLHHCEYDVVSLSRPFHNEIRIKVHVRFTNKISNQTSSGKGLIGVLWKRRKFLVKGLNGYA